MNGTSSALPDPAVLDQVDAGQAAWLRCDVHLARRPGYQSPDFSVELAYGLGDIAE